MWRAGRLLILGLVLVSMVGLLAAVTEVSSATGPSPHAPPKDAAQLPPNGSAPWLPWHLSFNATFRGSHLNNGRWATCYDWACTNPTQNELEWYTPANVRVSGGVAHLTARSQQLLGRDYTSGMIQSDHHFVFRYGYVAMLARVPSGRGFWSAFWTLPWNHDWPPEIDVVEVYGTDPAAAVLTVHYGATNLVDENYHQGPDLSKGYHVFAVDWEPNSITWYIDGAEVAKADVSINIPQYILANLAISGATPPTSATTFPSSLNIKWIRVWQHPGDQSWNGKVSL